MEGVTSCYCNHSEINMTITMVAIATFDSSGYYRVIQDSGNSTPEFIEIFLFLYSFLRQCWSDFEYAACGAGIQERAVY